MPSTEKARVLGKRREKKRRRLILSGSDEDDDNMVSTNPNKGLDEGGDGIKVETKSDLEVEAVKQVEAVEVHQNGLEDDGKKIVIAPLIEEKSSIDGLICVEEVKVESNMGLSSEAVDRMEVADGKDIENATLKKEINAENEIVLRSKDATKHKETGALGDCCKKIEIVSPTREKGCIDGSTHVEEVKVESNTGLSLEAVDRMEVDSTPKKEMHAEYKIVSRSKDVKEHKTTDALGDSCKGSGSAIKTKNGLDCSPSKEDMKIGLKKVLKSKVDNGREEVDTTKFSMTKRKNSIDKLSGKEVKVESNTGLSLEVVDGMEVDGGKKIENSTPKKEIHTEHEIVSRSEDAKKHKETDVLGNSRNGSGSMIKTKNVLDYSPSKEAMKIGLKKVLKSKVDSGREELDSSKFSTAKRKNSIDKLSGKELKVESNTGLSLEVVDRMEVDGGKKIENSTPKKEIHAEYEIVSRSEDAKKHKTTDALGDSRNGSGSMMKMNNGLDCSPSKEAMKIGLKKVLKSKVDCGREEVDSTKFSTTKIKNSIDKLSDKEVRKVEKKKVFDSKRVKGGEEAGGNKKSPSFSVSSRKMDDRVLLKEKKVELKKVPRSTVVKGRGEAECGEKRAVESGSERKRNRETPDDETHSKKFRLEHVKHRQELSSESGEKNMKRRFLKSGDEGYDNRQRDESDEKTMQEDLKKNEPLSENGRWMERSTARTLRKLKDNSTRDADISQQKGMSVHGKHGALRVNNKKARGVEGVHIQSEEKESKKFTGNHLALSKERNFEKPISTIKKASKVYVAKAKTVRGASSPKTNLKKVASSNVTTDTVVKGGTLSKSKASLLIQPNREEDGCKGGKGGTKRRSTEKQKIRDEIKGILLDAGWKIDLRPRNGRAYEDSVYIPPTGGGGLWSITKAYAKYMEQNEKNNASSEKQSKKATGGDPDHQGTTPTFVTVPADLLNMLTRKVVNKRRSKEEIERDEMLGVRKARIVRKDASESGKVRNKRRGLLVRGANPDANADDDNYVPYIWKRTIMSWMVDSGVVQVDGKVKYMNKKHTRALLVGSITRDGIRCSCCSKIISISKFEIHAGSKLRQPYQNIIVEKTGDSLLQCQVNAWEKQPESERQGFYKVDIEGDDPNDDTCGICGDGGDLICCDSCPSTSHLNCLDLQTIPAGEWHCTDCSCRYCGLVVDAVPDGNDSEVSTLLTCLQCEKNYHIDCIPEKEVISVSSNDSDVSFCGKNCKTVFKKLQKLIGTKNNLEAGLSWRLIRRFGDESSGYPCNLLKKVECNSKIAVAFAVMDECFCPIVDYRSDINLIHNVVYNCGSNINRLSYIGFYAFVLERGDEIISVASVRIHGTRLAEMPFIGTRNMYRRQGMCRQLLNGIESALYSLNVEKLIIPAISELTETWTNIFGFKHLDLSQRQEVRNTNMLVFPGTGLLQKPIQIKGSTEEHMTSGGGELGESVSEEKLIASNETTVHQNQEPDNAPSTVALGSNVPGGNSVGCASVIENQHLLGAANESSDFSFKPKLHGDDKGVTNPKFEHAIVCHNEPIVEDPLRISSSNESKIAQHAIVCHNEPIVEDAFRISSSNESKIEAPWEVMMLDNHDTKDRGVTDTPSLHVVEANHYAVGEGSGNGICDVKAELGPVKSEANTVDRDTEPCTDSVNDRRSGIPYVKESEANGSSVTNNSCNITEPDNGMPCDGCCHKQRMVARDSAPAILTDSASRAFTDCTLLDSSYVKSESGPDPHVHGSVAESPNSHAAEDFSCGVGPSICVRTASGSLSNIVAHEVDTIAADVSANPGDYCAEGVCDTSHSEDVSVDVIPAHSGVM